MENKNNQNNGIGSGFLLGILIGIILTLLITTKKGREILKDLLDRGIEKIADLEDAISQAKTAGSADEETDYIKEDPIEAKKEIRHLTVSKPEEKNPNPGQPETKIKKEPEADEEKIINEKGGFQKKTNKRLFFRRTQK